MTLLSDALDDFVDDELQAQRSLVRHSLDHDALVMYYQPIVDERGVAVAVEALARLQLSEDEVATPGQFMAAIEGTELVIRLDLDAFALSCAAARRLAEELPAPPVVSCNFSASTLGVEHLADIILRTIDRYGLQPNQMCIEVTETAVFEAGAGELRRLRDAGMVIALDNFGTGYSQLAGLRNLPLSCVKVDKTFTQALDKPGSEGALAITVLDLAMSLGIPVIAEGVENASQWRSSRKHGLTMMQGWLHSRPMPLAELVWHVIDTAPLSES